MRQRVVLEAHEQDAQTGRHWLYLSLHGESQRFGLTSYQLESWGLLDSEGRLLPLPLDSLWLELDDRLEIVALHR